MGTRITDAKEPFKRNKYKIAIKFMDGTKFKTSFDSDERAKALDYKATMKRMPGIKVIKANY